MGSDPVGIEPCNGMASRRMSLVVYGYITVKDRYW